MGARVEEFAVAIDVGGTKMAAGIVDATGTITERRITPTPPGADAEALFSALTRIVRELDASRAVVCGIGCGGPMSEQGRLVSPINIDGWHNFPLGARIAELTGLPTFVDNDAKALALAEGSWGAAVGKRHYIAMVVSTGIGGGIVLDGRLLDGEDGNAGHIGHVIVEPGGRTCGCGAQGCLEAEASGTALAALTGTTAEDADLSLRERTGQLVGRGVASVANLLDLRLAVVAGSVALGFGEPFFRSAQQEIERLTHLDFSRGTVIRPAGLGAEGPLLGGAAVGWRGLGRPMGMFT